MPAFMETPVGGEMVCIKQFHVQPYGPDHRPLSDEERTIEVGERVRLVQFHYDGTPADNPTGWRVVFQVLDESVTHHYEASDSLFLDLDTWNDIKRYLIEGLNREPWQPSTGRTSTARPVRAGSRSRSRRG